MIGVISKSAQVEAVEEFFQLFKTPWEFYRPEEQYDVVIVTAEDVPDVKTKVLFIYGASRRSIDGRLGLTTRKRYETATLYCETEFPIYCGLLTFAEGSRGTACARTGSEIGGVRVDCAQSIAIRLGYDLFEEVRFLLVDGQPLEHSAVPTLDIHIQVLREWILSAGIPLLEIPPVPAHKKFVVCLTHDIDFVGIRNHKFDHTMWGFLYRSTLGSIGRLLRRRIVLDRFFEAWRAAISLPLVFLGWAKDFWEPFEWYLQAEKGLPATYFLIPFKGRAGEMVSGPHPSRRAAPYGVVDISDCVATLLREGCEVGVHGIDSWHSVERAREELSEVVALTAKSCVGTRTHWLLHDIDTPSVLERAGFAYDSTVGYNDTVGYRAGTTQVFRPFGSKALLELPMHIQDGALFFPGKLNLTDEEAERRCRPMLDHARQSGGVLTLLWHDRSPGPERFWGDFYLRLLALLKSLDAWFGSGAQVVDWFRKRRDVGFERVQTAGGCRTRLRYEGEEIEPPLCIRIYVPRSYKKEESTPAVACRYVEILWDGTAADQLELQIAANLTRDTTLSSVE